LGLANFQWTPAEKEMLKILKITKVIKPCFISLKAIFFKFYLWIILAVINNIRLIANSPKSKHNMMLQLLMNEPATPNLLKLLGKSVA
jgi:hypothetical protein